MKNGMLKITMLLAIVAVAFIGTGCSDDSSWYNPTTWGSEYVATPATESEVLDDAEDAIEEAKAKAEDAKVSSDEAEVARQAAIKKLDEADAADAVEKARRDELRAILAEIENPYANIAKIQKDADELEKKVGDVESLKAEMDRLKQALKAEQDKAEPEPTPEPEPETSAEDNLKKIEEARKAAEAEEAKTEKAVEEAEESVKPTVEPGPTAS